MLIAFCLLYLTYSPWPVAGAIWTRSAKRTPDTDELREFVGSDRCESDHPQSSRSFSVTDASLSRYCLEAVQADFEDIFPNHGEWSLRSPGPWQSAECKRDEISSASTSRA